jgi:hypothetical protein
MAVGKDKVQMHFGSVSWHMCIVLLVQGSDIKGTALASGQAAARAYKVLFPVVGK